MVFLTASVALATLTALAQSDPESRVLAYIRDHLQAGQPLVVTQLYNDVFTTPEEHKALDKLYNAFFRIPLFVAQYQQKFGAPPTRKVIAEQFDLRTPEAAGVLIRVMETDPRVPRFFRRDEKTGEITAVDEKTILADPRFGKAAERQLSGWEGRAAPAFKLSRLEGGDVDSSTLRGKVVLLYVWFTGCPPCMKETPQLVTLARHVPSEQVAIVGANADRVLGLDYDDAVRRRYAEEHHIHFPLVHWTRESDAAFGNIAIYPTLFLMDPKGLVVRHWIGYVSGEEIRAAITKSLKAGPK
jgi:thiol-disulfide isomerase/thioredoxin